MSKKKHKKHDDTPAVDPAQAERDRIDAEIKARVAARKAERDEEERNAVIEQMQIQGVIKPPVTFTNPDDVPREDFQTNNRKQYMVKHPETGRLVPYTRTTTYIGNLEDETNLKKWLVRCVMEGFVVNEDLAVGERTQELYISRVRDLMHNRDLAIKKARKADRKGKLEVGELAKLIEAAQKPFKSAMDALAAELADLGRANEASAKGTFLHALCETYDKARTVQLSGHDEAIATVAVSHPEASPADLADVEAYAAAIERAGITIIPELIEKPIVVDELGVAGRADRFVMYKAEGWARARKVVLDVKSGRIDFGAGKIAQQLAMYASGLGYDLDTHERTKMGASRDIGLVLHLPAGTGKATVHEVDLKRGAEGIALSGKVRAWRRDSRSAIDVKKDVSER